jgi:hypothetical protein
MSDITEEPLKAARAKSLYTPGPWVVRDNQVGHTHTTHLPFCALAQVTGHIKNEANARLIAAAPTCWRRLPPSLSSRRARILRCGKAYRRCPRCDPQSHFFKPEGRLPNLTIT